MKKRFKKYAFSIVLLVLGGATIFLLLGRANTSSSIAKYVEKPERGDTYFLRDTTHKDYMYLLFTGLDGDEYVFAPSTFAYATVLAAEHARKEDMVEFAHQVRFLKEELQKLYSGKELIAIERNRQ